jgi:hypothetical protein
MAQNQATFSFEDYNKEKSSVGVNLGPITALNFTAVRDALDDLKTALGGITLGEIRKTSISEQFAESSATITDQNAQRERKWLVSYRDVTQFFDVANTINNVGFGNVYQVEVPTADLSLLTGNSDILPLTQTQAAAFVTAFEAIQNSPTGGNEIEVIEIKHVGRNI